MSIPYVGEIRMFAGNFAPSGWQFCDGQLMPISENETLFQLIGTTYGGDGQETFALPDLRGRVPLHAGTGIGRSARVLAELGGVESVTLSLAQIPAHTHAVTASTNQASNTASAANGVPGNTSGTNVYGLMGTPGPMAPGALAASGGNQPHDNMAPTLCVNFIISLFGIFPSQT